MKPSPPELHLVAGTGSSAGAEPAEALLRRLEWTVLRRLDGLLQGDHRCLMRGHGLDLADLREYQHHDDVRHLDWNVTARTGTPHVRVFTEDREISAWFLLDLSASANMGSGRQIKKQLSCEFVAAVARLLVQEGNRVGALLYGCAVDARLPARGGRRQVLDLLHRMTHRPAGEAGAGTRLGELIEAAASQLQRRSTVFLVSDFISEPGWEQPLAQLARRHDVVAVRVFDALERELPDLGLVTMRDAESGQCLWVDTHDRGFRQRFAQLAQAREAQLREAFTQAGVDALELCTDDDLLESLVRFCELRRQRIRWQASAIRGRGPARPASDGGAAACLTA